MLYARYGKRVFDITASLVILLITLPILILISVLLFIQNRGDIFFYHKRSGYQEKPFYMIKFKTMTDDKDEKGNLLPDMKRITAVGNWIRRLSLDELPQLLNILKGDMSLIGPRPLLMRYLPLYNDKQRKRHNVKPGITGWAQVNGRNTISWERKFELDVYYVDHYSFRLAMKILWFTILKVLKREGINQSDARPMQPFEGTNP